MITLVNYVHSPGRAGTDCGHSRSACSASPASTGTHELRSFEVPNDFASCPKIIHSGVLAGRFASIWLYTDRPTFPLVPRSRVTCCL
eukprot:4559520-Pleurochrysis_carterae.AAC.1